MLHALAAVPIKRKRLSSVTRRAAAIVALAAALVGCGERPPPEKAAEEPPTAVLTRVAFDALPGFGNDRWPRLYRLWTGLANG